MYSSSSSSLVSPSPRDVKAIVDSQADSVVGRVSHWHGHLPQLVLEILQVGQVSPLQVIRDEHGDLCVLDVGLGGHPLVVFAAAAAAHPASNWQNGGLGAPQQVDPHVECKWWHTQVCVCARVVHVREHEVNATTTRCRSEGPNDDSALRVRIQLVPFLEQLSSHSLGCSEL